MKRKILWLGVSFLLVAALVLPGCAEEAVVEEEEEAVVEEEEEEEVVEPPVGAPQDGGKLVALIHASQVADSIYNPDDSVPSWTSAQWLLPVRETALTGGLEEYGPRGTDEHSFRWYGATPEEYLVGQLVDSWEVLPDKVMLHVRPGIYWQGLNQGVRIMEDRELTAADIVASLLYYIASPRGPSAREYVGDIYTTGKYDLVIEFSNPVLGHKSWADGWGAIATFCTIGPPETEGTVDWDEIVGTGPFMYKRIELGSYMSFVPNPNYWDTTTINGVEYDIPFVDEMLCPIIPDYATLMATLRTGQADWSYTIEAVDKVNFEKTTPELLFSTWTMSGGYVVSFRCDEPPFDNVNVRRALMIGTNMDPFFEVDLKADLPRHFFPVHWDHPYYIPLEDLPSNIQVLYEYDPDEAVRLLELEGYPFGTLKVDMHMIAYTQAVVDRSGLLKSEWAKIGVELTIVQHEDAVHASMVADENWHGLRYIDESTGLYPVVTMWQFGSTPHVKGQYKPNAVLWENAEYLEIAEAMRVETDEAEIERMVKELQLIMLEEVPYLPTGGPRSAYAAWWPWLKNYYGEISSGSGRNYYDYLARVWIDQDLKAEMGY